MKRADTGQRPDLGVGAARHAGEGFRKMQPEIAVVRTRARKLGIIRTDAGKEKPLFDIHRSDPKTISFGIVLYGLCLTEIMLDFPISRLSFTPETQSSGAFVILILLLALVLLAPVRRYPSIGLGQRHVVFDFLPLIGCGVVAVIAVFLPAVGIWFYQGIAAAWLCFIVYHFRSLKIAKQVWAL